MRAQLSSDDWLVEETGFDPEKANFHETIFTIGNGYQGTRGSLEEGHKGELSGTYLAGVYDHHDSSVIDLVNAPSWLPLSVTVDGCHLDVRNCKVVEHSRALDLRQGLLYRNTLLEDGEGRRTRLESLRFCSFADQHLCGIRLEITLENYDATLSVESAIEGERYNLDRLPVYTEAMDFHSEVKWEKWAKSRHQKVMAGIANQELAYLETVTLDSEISIGCAAALDFSGDGTPGRGLRKYEYVAQTLEVEGKRGQICRFDKLAAIFTSRDLSRTKLQGACLAKLETARGKGFDDCLNDSVKAWLWKWDDSDCVIVGDVEATRAARFNIYHLLIAANEKDPRVNIGAKSMSGEGYKGHVFWDTEIFLLPFYIYTQPETAKALLGYRYHTLPGAIQNARDNGFAGAQYAWESADTGAETTPKWTAEGAHRIWTGEEEIHVTADVAYGVLTYVAATGDWDFMCRYGAEILFQTSRFWVSRLEFNDADGCYELNRVIGPDEFHEHVDDNTFTNRMAQWHLMQAAETYSKLLVRNTEAFSALVAKLGLCKSEVDHWCKVAGLIRIPFDPARNLIEQFAGYFQLEDLPIAEWDENGMPRYPAGHDHFTLNNTMLLKQPDVVMLTYLLPDEFTAEEKRANFEFYEARTMHKSSLSPAIHAIMGIEVGDMSSAHRYFARSAFVDLVNNQGNTQDGIHIASAGGTWQSLVCGFGGFRVHQGRMTFKPWLPKHWKELCFKIRWKGHRLKVSIAHEQARFLLASSPDHKETIEVSSQTMTLIGGQERVVSL
ncbi:glycoside hydrolase family 65 protein [Pelagibius sp. Alg239-R121]|uniref:glycoside hydrolase family 65 protein n=1 Tax=Pelagibius sp. Alg239-R121 TaxID=2993448 RepID=UPI0024A67211|nr:glycosyl hydrolase family 65 protein [Pelagibius sp. Alg239-R121]